MSDKLFYKIEKTASSALPLQKLAERIVDCTNKIHELLDEFGVTEYTSPKKHIHGGIEALVFETEPDMNVWKLDKRYEDNNVYQPRLNTKEGKRIKALFDSLPVITRHDANMTIAYNDDFDSIGFYQNNDTYYGIVVRDFWKVKIPKDAIEITVTEFKKLFKE